MAEIVLKRKKKSRQGHRLYLNKSLDEATACLEDPSEEREVRLIQLRDILEGQLPTLTTLDEEILEIISAKEEENAEEIANEIEVAGNLKWKIKTTITKISSLIEKETVSPTAPSGNSSNVEFINKRIKLPRLEVKKFDGKLQDWQTFWDGFESSIHKNSNLSDIDKFTYLRGLLQSKASLAIEGFALTSANYNAAIELLKGRFGKKTSIQRAHIDALMKISPVFNDKDTARLRQLYDTVETHHRGLQALGVNTDTYSSIVVPSVVQKLPEQVRLTITRGKNHTTWNMEEMLKVLLEEVELREDLHFEKEFKPHDRSEGKGNTGKPSTANALVTNTNFDKCAYCQGLHEHKNCEKITSISKRKELIRKYGRCFICIRKGHKALNCNSNVKCENCQGRHHISICENSKVLADSAQTSITSPSLHIGLESRVALQTAQAVVKGNSCVKVRVMFDSGSHRSFITPKVVKSAGLVASRKEWVEISTFGQQVTDRGLREVYLVDLQSVKGGDSIQIEAYNVPSISQISNEHIEMRKHEYPHLQNLWFSDVCRREEKLEIDLLIGADYLWNFQEGRTVRGERGEPVAIETKLGWVLSGPVKGDYVDSRVKVNFVSQNTISSQRELDNSVKKLWDLETLGIREEDEVLEGLRDDIKFNGTRYKVSLPWKEAHETLPSNYRNSLKRLSSQLGRLRREPDVLSEYNSIIEDQHRKGIIEEVVELEKVENVHYLPHHAVVKRDAKTTKVRVVFDASSKEGGKSVSLNDCLHVGPPLTPLLYNILIRFREKRVALVGDIEKAFLNIEVEEKDRDSLRFLWVKDINKEKVETLVYRFCRVVFGVNCSPFLLNATIHHHLETYSAVDPEFVERMKNSFYVDDLVTGEQTEEKAFSLFEKAQERLATGGFRLRKWLTNSPELRNKITQGETGMIESDSKIGEDDLTYAKVALGATEDKSLEKVLGMIWNLNSDTIHFKLSQIAEKAEGLEVTRRTILKVIAGLYDPLGIVSPIIVEMKSVFQELCIDKVNWDEQLPFEVVRKWKEWIGDLKDTQEIQVSRCLYGISEVGANYSIHGFADASRKAYCAVVYFVCEAYDNIHVEFLTAKTRVTPAKAHTIPRLELMGCRILAKLVDTVKGALEKELELGREYLWSDSKTALCWINNKGEWKQFVKNRVNEILKLTRKEDWNHCPGVENPADLGSRGVLASRLASDQLWWKGPKWLSEPRENWPLIQEVTDTPESFEEIRKAAVMTGNVVQLKSIANVIRVERYSSLGRLLAVTAWVKRFVFNLQACVKGEVVRSGSLTRLEGVEAEKVWIKDVQSGLRKQGNYRQLVNELGLVEDDGILRCKGRLLNSDLELEAMQPVILSKDNAFTNLVIEGCHKRVLHCGLRATLAELRARYWVPRGRQVVKKILGKCTVCKKQQGRHYVEPPMAALPDFRVKEAPAFSRVGVDFAGPLYVKDKTGKEMEKVYIALWTCCVTRGVSLDLTSDLNTKSFLCALRRFAARRGTPSLIVSDNAKTFKAANKYLNKLFDSAEVKSHLEENRIEWKFNLERAPWWGGFFERMVGTVKSCLKKVLGNAKLTFDELLTVLLEVEGTVNARPLTYEYDELGAEVLTPAHLMYGRRLVSVPDEMNDEDEEYEGEGSLIKRFRHLAKKKLHYWNRWHKEYLTDLREHHRRNENGTGVEARVGDVVLIQEDKLKRGKWKLGVVQKLIVGRDQRVRGATVKLISKGKPIIMSRSVRKLYPLEIRSTSEVKQDDLEQEIDDNEEQVKDIELADHMEMKDSGRPRRAAALDSRWKTRVMLDP